MKFFPRACAQIRELNDEGRSTMGNKSTEKANPYSEVADRDDGISRVPTLAGAPTKLVVREIRDDDGNVTYKLESFKGKFGDEEKATVVEQLAIHGRLGTAARAAGVTAGTVRRHVKQDKEFGEAVAEAIECYKDQLISHHQDLVFNGEVKEHYDREGNLVSRERRYPVRLIELELKKHDPGYRDKQQVEHTHKGGVMVAPAQVTDIDDWEKRFGQAKDVTPPVDDVVEAEKS